MANWQIVESEFKHIGQLCGTLRYDDFAELSCFGIRPFVAIKKSFQASHLRRSVFINNELGAMWGLAGVMLGGRGQPWLLTSPVIETIPLSFVRQGKQEISLMFSMCSSLEGIVPNFYTRAHRFLEVLGFELSEPFVVKGVPVRRYYMEA